MLQSPEKRQKDRAIMAMSIEKNLDIVQSNKSSIVKKAIEESILSNIK